MYSTMLVFGSEKLLDDVRNLSIWDGSEDFEITAAVNNGDDAYKELVSRRYDLVICETDIAGMDAETLLCRANEERLCGHIALCSEKADFEYARKGIIYGAFDYFVPPFDENEFKAAFLRIKNKISDAKSLQKHRGEEIIGMFERHDDGIYEYISGMVNDIAETAPDREACDSILSGIYKTVIDEIFKRNEWLDLYKSSRSFFEDENLYASYGDYVRGKIGDLYDEYVSLLPLVNNSKIREVILHILNNPESDLKQKTIASEHYINSSYLSTVFSAQTQMRFVDYLTTVKLKRAGWLLQNSPMKVTEIASRLDYKDIGYFSRMFKKQYGVTPTEYKIPDGYTYQI